jgi:hypothetical protein
VELRKQLAAQLPTPLRDITALLDQWIRLDILASGQEPHLLRAHADDFLAYLRREHRLGLCLGNRGPFAPSGAPGRLYQRCLRGGATYADLARQLRLLICACHDVLKKLANDEQVLVAERAKKPRTGNPPASALRRSAGDLMNTDDDPAGRRRWRSLSRVFSVEHVPLRLLSEQQGPASWWMTTPLLRTHARILKMQPPPS